MFNWLSVLAGLALAAAGQWICAHPGGRNAAANIQGPLAAPIATAPANDRASVDDSAAVAAPPDRAAPYVAADFQPTGLRLSGRLPDAATRDRLLQRARLLYGAKRINDQTTIDSELAGSSWVNSEQLFLVLPTRGATRAEFDGRQLVLSGSVPRQELADQIADEAQQQAGDNVRVLNRMVVSAAVTPEPGINATVKLANVEFLSNSSVFTARGQARLQQNIDILVGNAPARYQIAGHTDSRGDARVNQRLSEARAVAARDYLVQAGLSADRFVALGYGETRPIASNKTRRGRQRNRRVEFVQLSGEEK